MQKNLIDVAIMDEHEEKKEALTKEEKEDLKDISRSEDEGFGIISEGYRFKEDRVIKEKELNFKKIDVMLEKLQTDILQKSYPPLKATLILIFSILITEISLKYCFMHFSALSRFNIPIINAVILVMILLPILYYFVFKPMSIQYEKLEKSEVIQRELSLLDTLTGLYNRRGFILYANHLLKLAVRAKKEILLIYADLDNLKWINDHLGHEGGDRAITCVANVLTAAFRGSDVIGRIGGDEFAILAFEAKEENIDMLRDRLDQKLKEAENKFNSTCTLTLSMGIIYYNPNKSQNIEDLLKQADTLMYEVKRTRHKVAFNVKIKEDE